MRLIERAKNIIVSPKSEWDAIAADPTPTQALVVGYVLPLAALAAIASFIGLVVVGQSLGHLGTMRLSLTAGIVQLVLHLVMSVLMVFVVGFIIDALAPTFGAQKSMPQAVKVAAYCYTPMWLVGILGILPALKLLGLLALLYAIYLLYLGLPRVMKGPQEKAAGYTAVVIVVSIVVGVLLGMLTAGIMTTIGANAVLGGSPRSNMTYDRGSPMGKLDEFSKKMEAASKKMEDAQKSGDAGKQAQAAMGALGVALSGGKGVDPVSIDQLKPFVPPTFAGLPQTDLKTERSGVTGLMIAKAEATYGDGSGKRVELQITDTGGAAGLVGLASWMGVQGEKEDSNRREVTRKEGNRLVHEEVDKRGGSNKYTVVAGERFVVSARGRGTDIDTLRSAVASLDLAKLEALK